MDKKFLETISEVLKISTNRLKEDSTASSIPEWDSLNHWAVIDKLEETYGIEFTMDEATGFKNLGDIFNTLESKLK